MNWWLVAQLILLLSTTKIAKEYGDDDSNQGDSYIDDDEDDNVCEQMSRGSEGVHSLAPIALFLPLSVPAWTLFRLALIGGAPIPPPSLSAWTSPPDPNPHHNLTRSHFHFCSLSLISPCLVLSLTAKSILNLSHV